MDIFGFAGFNILMLVSLLWVVSLVLRNASIVDIFWGTGFVITAWLYFMLTPDNALVRKWLICALVTVWGFRLSLHIFVRNYGKPEDFRYKKWRDENGASWWWYSYLKVFLLQGGLMWVISTPLLVAQFPQTTPQLNWLDAAGIIIWAIGFFFEVVGDWQLMKFKRNPENSGKLLRSGVWKYTRHPNYFGDAAQWWGYFLIATAAGGYWTIYSPILMTWLIVKISGVSMLERSLSKRKPGYADYVQQTNAFFPWLPKERKRTRDIENHQ